MMRAQLPHSDPGAHRHQDAAPSYSPSAEGDDAQSPLPGLVRFKSSFRFADAPPISPTRMRASDDPNHSSPIIGSRRKSATMLMAEAGNLMKSSRESFAMRMRSHSIHRFLPTQQNVETLIGTKRESPVQQQNLSSSAFVGPLAFIYSGGRIKRCIRYAEDQWEDAMGTGGRFPSHEAEKSGLTTFWQAILIAAEKVKCAMDALKTLTDDKKIQHSMVNDLYLAVGKLTNTIGLSWDWDHVKNLSKVGERHAENMNCNGLKHRHTHMHKKAWVVLEKLGRLMKTVKEPDWKDISESVESVHASYIEFFVYLVYTSQIVLEDALFCYRSQLKENEVSSVGRAAARHNAYDELLDWALNIIVGATPKNQRHERLQAMGYDWMRARIVSISCARMYQRKFVKPLDAIIAAVHPSQQAYSRPSSIRSSMSENDSSRLHELIRHQFREDVKKLRRSTEFIRRKSCVTFTQRPPGGDLLTSIDNLVLARSISENE